MAGRKRSSQRGQARLSCDRGNADDSRRSMGLETDAHGKNHSRLSQRQDARLCGNGFELCGRRRMRCRPHSAFGERNCGRALPVGRGKSHPEGRARHFGRNYRFTRAFAENPARPGTGCSLCGDRFFTLDRPRAADSGRRREDRAAHDVCGLLPCQTRTRFRGRPGGRGLCPRRVLVRNEWLHRPAPSKEDCPRQSRIAGWRTRACAGTTFVSSFMRILVTFAVEAEFAPWRRLRNLEPTAISDVPVFRARVGSAKVDFAVTGMGVDNSYRVTKTLLAEPYQACITSGFAGSLKQSHAVGHVLVADSVQELGKTKTLACARNLVEAARDDGATRVGMFLTSGETTCRRLWIRQSTKRAASRLPEWFVTSHAIPFNYRRSSGWAATARR